MWFFLGMLVLLLAGSVFLNVVVIRKNLTLSDQREFLADQIEESLDVLDGCYIRLKHNAEIPVFSDEPIIREVLGDIKRALNAVLAIASKVVIYGEDTYADEGERGT